MPRPAWITESCTVMSGPEAWMPTNGPIASIAVSPGMPKSDSPRTTWSSGRRTRYRLGAVRMVGSVGQGGSRHLGERAAHLAEMEEAVPRHQAEGEIEALRSSLGVDAHPGSVARRGPRPQREMRALEDPEHCQHLRGVLARVVEPLDPQILVVADEGRLVLGQDPPIPTGEDDLRVEDVRKDLHHRPLAGYRSRAKAWACFFHHLFELVRQVGLSLGRVPVTQDAEQHVPIPFGLGHRVHAKIQRRLDVDGFRIRHAEILALGGLAARLHDESKLLARDPPDDLPAAGRWEVDAAGLEPDPSIARGRAPRHWGRWAVEPPSFDAQLPGDEAHPRELL